MAYATRRSATDHVALNEVGSSSFHMVPATSHLNENLHPSEGKMTPIPFQEGEALCVGHTGQKPFENSG